MARIDPVASFKFHVEIAGIIEGGFTECKGLDIKWKVKKYKEGGVNSFIHQLPERVQYSKVTLKRGLAYSQALWNWCQQGIHNGQVQRKNVSIILFDVSGREIKRWNLVNAYPIKWTAPALKTTDKKAAIETLQLVHHGMTVVSAAPPT